MKKALVVVMIGFVAASAQNQGFSKGDKTLSFGLNGINSITQNASPAGSLLYRIFKSETKAVRIGLNIDVTVNNTVDPPLKVLYSSTNYGGGYIRKYTINRRNTNNSTIGVEFSYGKQIQIYKINRFETYFYGDLGLKLRYSNTLQHESWGDSINEYEYSNNSYYSGSSSYKPGDYVKSSNLDLSIGITSYLGFGFNYYLTDYISIGSEFGYGISISNTIIKTRNYESKRDDYVYTNNGSTYFNNYELRANNFRALILFQFLICKKKETTEVKE